MLKLQDSLLYRVDVEVEWWWMFLSDAVYW
jgi:hypothetical protein